MNVSRLNIRNFRNIESVGIALSPGLNFFLGPNGSGKTSLLEGLYLLSRGRSFRTQNLKRLLRIGSDRMQLRVHAGAHDGLPGESVDAFYPDKDSRLVFKISGQRIERTTDLSLVLPVVLLHQDSHLLISSGPKYRRHFLDIGVFHVKPNYISVWQYYKRALHQRNAALRGGASNIELWDNALSTTAVQLDEFRRAYIEVLNDKLGRTAREVVGIDGPFSIDYQRGWKHEETLLDTLRRCIERDRTLGYTRDGPHRAELMFNIGGQPVKDFLSRGQQKLLVYALFFAQAEAMTHFTASRPIVLADDVTAEVDDAGVERVLHAMRRICDQAIITNQSLPLSESSKDATLFHVKHGQVS
ncbi:MAG: DNA replication/repair protein RecF [Gammaproteobacteria bacterium]|nr:DNA replication/repair protein RecF [Gammaproteobacteria bacterium]